jgi:hypothetical protein
VIEDNKPVGSHDDQRLASMISALAKAGIGRSYAARTLDMITPEGPVLKDYLLDHYERFRLDGFGIDFRGVGPKAVDLVNLTGRAFLMMHYTTWVLPLVRLPKLIADKDELQALKATQCLIIRDFETTHETPLRPYEIAEVEAFLADRFGDARSVSVWRQGLEPRGWWSGTLEALIEANTSVREIGR